jgi:hypothetical protein
MKKIIVMAYLLLVVFTFIACKKEGVKNEPLTNPVGIETVNKMNAWLNKQKASTTPERPPLFNLLRTTWTFQGFCLKNLTMVNSSLLYPLIRISYH